MPQRGDAMVSATDAFDTHYATLRETGEIHAFDLRFEYGYHSPEYGFDFPDADDKRSQWHAEVVAPWWAAMAERAARDGMEIECFFGYDNGMIEWGYTVIVPVVRRYKAREEPPLPMKTRLFRRLPPRLQLLLLELDVRVRMWRSRSEREN
jgi:hypothetical protein